MHERLNMRWGPLLHKYFFHEEIFHEGSFFPKNKKISNLYKKKKKKKVRNRGLGLEITVIVKIINKNVIKNNKKKKLRKLIKKSYRSRV